jgi:hypothetical protein
MLEVVATPEQLRAGRALLRARQRHLAARLGISEHSVLRAENGHRGSGRTQRQLQMLLAHEGIVFGVDGTVRRAVAAAAEVPQPVADATAVPAEPPAPTPAAQPAPVPAVPQSAAPADISRLAAAEVERILAAARARRLAERG